jgi:hypothetical protein
MDLLEEVLARHGEDGVECTFGFYACLAAWFVPSAEMPTFVTLVEDLLKNRGRPVSSPRWKVFFMFSVPEESLELFYDNCLRMMLSV